MQDRSRNGFTGWAQLSFLLIFTAIGFTIAGAIQLYFGMKALGLHSFPSESQVNDMMTAMLKPENSSYAQLSQISGSLFLLFLPAFLFTVVCHKKISWAGFNKYFSFTQILIAGVIIFVANFFSAPFEDISKAVLSHFPHYDQLAKNAESLYNKEITSMSTLNSWPQFFLAIIIIAFLPALFEEFFFRGVIQNFLMRWLKKPFIAIVITAALFSVIHASYYLFISRFILGFALGLLFYQSRNIWVNAFAHFLNNFLAIIPLFILNTSKKSIPNIDSADAKLSAWSLPLTFAILIVLFIVFNKISKTKREQIVTQEGIDFYHHSVY